MSDELLFIPQLFQFTHPGRGATPTRYNCGAYGSVVPSPPPGVGCHDTNKTSETNSTVSIHAPREGCDTNVIILCLVRLSFNSRTPGGVRRLLQLLRLWLEMFQFTHPGRGATVWCKVAYYGADKQA